MRMNDLGAECAFTAGELRRIIGPARGLASLRRIVGPDAPAGVFFKAALLRGAIAHLPADSTVRVEFDPFAEPGDLKRPPKTKPRNTYWQRQREYDKRPIPPIVMRITGADGRIANFIAQNPPAGFEVTS